MDAKKVLENLMADGWSREAATAAARIVDRYEATLPLPGLAKLGHRLMDSIKGRAA